MYAILTGATGAINGDSDYTFTIDGNIAGVFQREPEPNLSPQFNQTVFSISGLDNTTHTLNIVAGDAGKQALVLLDSIIYVRQLLRNA